MNILIAEDNAVNRELLRELLELRGHSVFEACNGQEALDMIDDVRPELLVLDLDMPVLDGFAAIRKIRANPAWNQVPAIAATAFAMSGDRERALEVGFDGYVCKPIDAAALKKEINRLIGGGRGEEKNAAFARQPGNNAT